MKKIYLVMMLCVALFVNANAQELDRSKAPAPGPAPKINIGEYKSFELKNGLKVFVVENHTLPRVSFQLSFDIDPVKEGDMAGYVSMAGSLLKKGTANRSKDQINEEVDFIGASLFTTSRGIFASSLVKHKDKLLDVMTDVLFNPTFPEEEFNKLKTETKSGLASSKTDADAIADNISNILLYGKDHPYGENVTEATVEKISIEKIREYYKMNFKPNNAYLVILGDIKYKDAKKLAKKRFGSWEQGNVPSTSYDVPMEPKKTEVAVVDKPGAVQSLINISYPINLKPGSSDAIKVSMLNAIFGGGGFNTRLMQNIREDKGWTYGAYSRISSDEEVGYFTASAKVRNNVTDSAVTEFLKEMTIIRNKKITKEELEIVKNRMIGSFARSLESPQTVARFALNTVRYQLPDDYYTTYLQKVEAVTIEDIQMMAKKYIRPENAYVIVVGSADDVKTKLAKFGEVIEYDINGEVVVEEEGNGLPPGLTAEKVVERYIEVRGGREKLAALKDVATEMEASMGGQTFAIKIYETEGKKAVVSPMGKQVLDGEQGMMNPELDYAGNGFKLKLIAKKKVNGEDVYQVELTSPKGQKVTQYYSVATGFLIQSAMKGGTISFSNYLEVGGVKFPYEIKQGPLPLKVKSIKVNEGIDESIFKQ